MDGKAHTSLFFPGCSIHFPLSALRISPRAGPQDLPHCGGLALRGAGEDAADSGRLEQMDALYIPTINGNNAELNYKLIVFDSSHSLIVVIV